jgi:hypothetical protein
MPQFDPIDFQPNSAGVMVVRVIRLQDIAKALRCSEAFAREVVREIRGETSANGELAFVLPSQLAAWAYQRAGKPASPFPFESVLVKDARGSTDALRLAAAENRNEHASNARVSGATALASIRSDLRRLTSETIQPGSLAITCEQAAARLGCSRSRVFEFLNAGRLKRAPKLGRRTMVTTASVDELLVRPGGEPSVRFQKPRRKASENTNTKASVLALRKKYGSD